MTITQLQRIRDTQFGGADGPRALPQPGRSEGAGGSQGLHFSDAFSEAIDKVDMAQKEADGQISSFVAGEQENVHEVMIAMNQAKLSFQLMTEVRNRMLETYQELMRMQV